MSGIYAVIPAYNEAATVAQAVRGVLPYVSRVVVVDDGSCDDTAAQAKAAGAKVVRHAVNLGQGAALQTGIDYALLRKAEIIVTFDADGQHDPADIPSLVAALAHADVAFGSRFLGQAVGMGRLRGLFLKLARAYTYATTGLMLSDTQNGVRALSAQAARRIRLRQNRMAHAAEFIAQVAQHKLRFAEVPCTVRYTDYSRAKGQKSRHAIYILLDLFLKRIGS